MRMIVLLCVGIGAALLTGCQEHRPTVAKGPPPGAQVCNAGCDVIVTVVETPGGPEPCKISDIKDINVEGHDRTIRWKMDAASETAKFRFAKHREGVKFKPGVTDPNHQFSDKGPQGGGAQYHWDDKNNEGVVKPYDYEIHVYKDNPHSGITCKLDPRIWNS